MYVYTASATINNCVLCDNVASTDNFGYGGGLYIAGGDTLLSSNVVQSNTASTGERCVLCAWDSHSIGIGV